MTQSPLVCNVIDNCAQYSDDQHSPGYFERSTQSYTRWDLGGEYRFPLNDQELIAFVERKNIGGEEIRLSTSFLRDVAPESGRSLAAGFRYHFWGWCKLVRPFP